MLISLPSISRFSTCRPDRPRSGIQRQSCQRARQRHRYPAPGALEAQQQAAIITKDEDFAERCLYSRDQPVIVWLRIGNTSNQALLSWFVPLWPEIIRRIELGDRLIEVS